MRLQSVQCIFKNKYICNLFDNRISFLKILPMLLENKYSLSKTDFRLPSRRSRESRFGYLLSQLDDQISSIMDSFFSKIYVFTDYSKAITYICNKRKVPIRAYV